MDIKKEIENSQISLLLIPNSGYSNSMQDIIANDIKFNKLGYISLNKPAAIAANSLKGKVKTGNIVFLDVSQDSKQDDSIKCIHVASLGDLLRISLSIPKLLNEEKVDVILFDSLSTLLSSNSDLLVIKFAQNMMAKIRNVGCKGIFPCPKDDISQRLVKDLEMFADKTITI